MFKYKSAWLAEPPAQQNPPCLRVHHERERTFSIASGPLHMNDVTSWACLFKRENKMNFLIYVRGKADVAELESWLSRSGYK